MANHQNAATLGVSLSLETGNFVTEAQKVAYETQKLKNTIAREMRAADKEIQALKYSTEDYGKAVTKVTEIERQLESGRLKSIKGTDKAKELLAQAAAYDKIASAQKKVTTGMNEQQKLSLTYQTTDLFTQIASGGNPMIALIQQGGQLKDSMGGLGNMFRMLGTFITPVNVGIAVTATAVGALGFAAYKAQAELKQFLDSMALTGQYAGVTYSKLIDMGNALSGKVGSSIGSTRDVLNELVGSGQFTFKSMDSVASAILKFAKVAGVDAKEAAKSLIPLMDGTASSAKTLNDKYHFLNIEQYKHIKQLEEQGRLQEAAKYTAEKLTESISGNERELRGLEKAWKDVGEWASKAWDNMIGRNRDGGAGRAKELEDKINTMTTWLELRKSKLSAPVLAEREAQLQSMKDELDAIVSKAHSELTAAEAKSAAAAKNKKDIDWDAKYGTMGAQKSIELARQVAETKFIVAMNAADELNKFTLEKEKAVEDARQEMHQKNESEKNNFTFRNTAIFNEKVLQAEAQKSEKLKQFWLKRYMEQQAVFSEGQQETIDAANARGKLNEQISKAATDTTRNLENQKKLLELKYSMIYATEKEQKLAENTLKYDLLRKENVGKDDEVFLNNQLAKQQAIETFNIQIEDSARKLKEVYDSVWGNMSSAIDNFVRTGKLSFKDLAKSIIQDLIAIQMKAQATGLMNMLFRSLSGYTPGGSAASNMPDNIDIGGGWNPMTNMPAANGGSLDANKIGLVGELGPELFIPKTAGTIIPNNALGGMGGTTNVTNYNINAIDTKSFEDRLLGSSMAVWAANQYAGKSMPTNFGRT